MATYKVIQDIEADDKFVGPLTLKQFIFAMIGIFFAYLSFFAAREFPFGLIIFLPPMLLGFFLAIPWSKHQPTEVWVLAKLRFLLVPRKRIWDQTGMEELVTITAPKKEEKPLTDNLSQTEVKSRLQALAQTIDSRGWAVKDIDQNTTIQKTDPGSDRLVDASILPQEVPIMDTSTLPDMYVDKTPASENFDRMIEQSTELHRYQNLEEMDNARKGKSMDPAYESNFHITPPPAQPNGYYTQSIDEESLTEELKNRKSPDEIATSHMRKVNPIGKKGKNHHPKKRPEPEAKQPEKTQETPVTSPKQAAILGYAGNNDLDVATIARQAKKDTESEEVVISLR